MQNASHLISIGLYRYSKCLLRKAYNNHVIFCTTSKIVDRLLVVSHSLHDDSYILYLIYSLSLGLRDDSARHVMSSGLRCTLSITIFQKKNDLERFAVVGMNDFSNELHGNITSIVDNMTTATDKRLRLRQDRCAT